MAGETFSRKADDIKIQKKMKRRESKKEREKKFEYARREIYSLLVFHQKAFNEIFRVLGNLGEGLVIEVVLRNSDVGHSLDICIAHERR